MSIVCVTVYLYCPESCMGRVLLLLPNTLLSRSNIEVLLKSIPPPIDQLNARNANQLALSALLGPNPARELKECLSKSDARVTRVVWTYANHPWYIHNEIRFHESSNSLRLEPFRSPVCASLALRNVQRVLEWLYWIFYWPAALYKALSLEVEQNQRIWLIGLQACLRIMRSPVRDPRW